MRKLPIVLVVIAALVVAFCTNRKKVKVPDAPTGLRIIATPPPEEKK